MKKLGEARLKNGETLEIGVVEAPDDEYRDVVLNLLSHKRDAWQWHIGQAFEGKTGNLRNLFYLGFINGEAVSNITIWQSGFTGDLGHVYTREEHRRKGICKATMQVQMDDFREQGGRYCVLGTGYDSHPYHIYKSFGFESLQPGSGAMYYQRDEEFWSDFLKTGDAVGRNIEWEDWSDVCTLMACPTADWYRGRRSRIFGPTCFEFSMLNDVESFHAGKNQLRVLEGPGGIVGYAALAPDPEWKGNTCLLDLTVHPAFAEFVPGLLEGFDWPDAKVTAWLQGSSPTVDAMKKAGFKEEGRLSKMFKQGDMLQDIAIVSR
ncbi:MAG: GNAT family N-acetyltransferase [Planctomycetota bacterium]|nr:GNAT family N-acetyltransferase [Planctomycetota bacterium]MDA1142546.1 GNAT family N-acetyltransferase [Planctomycetota bacterium]